MYMCMHVYVYACMCVCFKFPWVKMADLFFSSHLHRGLVEGFEGMPCCTPSTLCQPISSLSNLLVNITKLVFKFYNTTNSLLSIGSKVLTFDLHGCCELIGRAAVWLKGIVLHCLLDLSSVSMWGCCVLCTYVSLAHSMRGIAHVVLVRVCACASAYMLYMCMCKCGVCTCV